MQVRLATVGPLFGTCFVSGVSTATRSIGTPSVSATIWPKSVVVPWPNSVEPESTRSPPSRVSVTAARLFR